jgi:chromosomal replication initiation ATPase DnaA
VLAPSVEEVTEAVAAYYGVDEATLFISRRGVTNEPRDVAIHLTRTLCGTPLQEPAKIGSFLARTVFERPPGRGMLK